MADTNFPFYGYILGDEDAKALEASAAPMPMLAFTAPEEIDPRPWHRIENQRSMGSCQGHALSSLGEYAYHIATGEIIQFSPMWCYLMTQKKDGLLGSDRGSTIDGGRRVAQEDGFCPLEIFPYPNPVRYSTKIPDGAAEAAAKFKLHRHVMIKSYQDAFDFLASGQGGVEIGIPWGNNTVTNLEGVMENYRPGGGGHAVCFLGYSKRRDTQGRKYLWLANSWSPQGWGKNGWGEIAPKAVEQMLAQRYTVMIGQSDMPVDDVKVRKVDWVKNSVFKGNKVGINVASV